MPDFILEYDSLESIAKNSRSMGKRAEEYSQSLESKVIYAIGNVTGVSSGYLSSASDSVRDKINALKQKSEAFYHFAEQVSNLLEVAERIDLEVADAIAAQREYFLDHHESLRLADWKAKLLNLLVDLKNSIPLLRTIADLLDGFDALLESMDDTIQHWYECEGGKYILETIGSVALAVIAVATFVAAFPVSGFFAICGAIGAGIAAVNSVVNVATSFEAAGAAVNDNPAWAMIYGKQDKLSDVLRQTNFGNNTANNLSNLGAGGLDTVETFCDMVGLVGMGADALKFFKGDAFKLLKNKGSLDFSDLKGFEKNGIVDSKSTIKQGYIKLKDGIKESADTKSLLGDGPETNSLQKAVNEYFDNVHDGKPKIAVSNEVYDSLKGSGLSREKIEDLRNIPKRRKPDPKTYLDENYIKNHNDPFIETGCFKIMKNDPTTQYNGVVGPPGGVFVSSGKDVKTAIEAYAQTGDINVIENAFGYNPGELGSDIYIVGFDNVKNMRIPSGNEVGAFEDYWIPGGFTSGNKSEVCVDPSLPGEYSYMKLENPQEILDWIMKGMK